MKTESGHTRRKIRLYCGVLGVSRAGFYGYMANRDRPYKYALLAALIKGLIAQDDYNDKYGRKRVHEALVYQQTAGKIGLEVHIPSEPTVYRIMKHEGLVQPVRRKPNGITEADKDAMKSDDLIKRDFKADKPCEKTISDITEIKCKDKKLYLSGMFDCFDITPLAIEMADNMRAGLAEKTLVSATRGFPELKRNKAISHTDRGSQYTSRLYRGAIEKAGLRQSMNSAGGRCHDNARCESIWARFKEECLYGRYDTEKMMYEDVKKIVWRYFMSYWPNRRICSAIGGLPPAEKRRRYYAASASGKAA